MSRLCEQGPGHWWPAAQSWFPGGPGVREGKTLTPPFFISTYVKPLDKVGDFQLMEGLPSEKWSPALGFLVGPEDELEALSGGRKHLTEWGNEWI